MDTGGEKTDNDIMMESTTSDSGKKSFFFTVLQKKGQILIILWIPGLLHSVLEQI